MITANLAGTTSHLRAEREKYTQSHSRLNLNEDNSDSVSRLNQEINTTDWNPNETSSEQDAEKLSDVCMKRCSHYKAWLTLGCMGLVLAATVILIILLGMGVISTNS